MRNIVLGLIAVATVPATLTSTVSVVHAQTAPKFTIADTPIGTLLENPATKAVLMKIIPEIAGNEQFAQAGSLTLKALASYANGAISDEKLAQIDAELAKIK